jgi:hypothetical protein
VPAKDYEVGDASPAPASAETCYRPCANVALQAAARANRHPPEGKRPTLPGIPGPWINVGKVGQLHLIGGVQPSPLAKEGPDKDPVGPHVALAVADVVQARDELVRLGVDYWVMEGVNGLQAQQLFLRDPNGNMIEVHHVGQCRCRTASRRPLAAE